MKPTLFIASSSEGAPVMTAVKDKFCDQLECKPWTQSFEYNRGNLENLLRLMKVSDYAIVIGTADDMRKKRQSKTMVPRDNVIFELGLAFGSLGPCCTYFLLDKSTVIPTDLDGVNVFKCDLNDAAALATQLNLIAGQIEKAQQEARLSNLPSTALAIGYFKNFILRVCTDLRNNRAYYIADKRHKVKDFTFRVVVPSILTDSGLKGFRTEYFRDKEVVKGTILGGAKGDRGYDIEFFIEPDCDPEDQTIRVLDVPNTLDVAIECISLFLPSTTLGGRAEVNHLRQRELSNFIRAMEFLINSRIETSGRVIIEVQESDN